MADRLCCALLLLWNLGCFAQTQHDEVAVRCPPSGENCTESCHAEVYDCDCNAERELVCLRNRKCPCPSERSECREGKCECKRFYQPDFRTGECAAPFSRWHSCSQEIGCYGSLICDPQYHVCECPKGFTYIPEKRTCEHRPEYGGKCSAGKEEFPDCHNSEFWHHGNPKTTMECGNSDVCTCIEDYIFLDGYCVRNNSDCAPGASCNDSNDTCESHTRVCHCTEGAYECSPTNKSLPEWPRHNVMVDDNNDWKCRPGRHLQWGWCVPIQATQPGDYCTPGTTCSTDHNLECDPETQKCKCRSGYQCETSGSGGLVVPPILALALISTILSCTELA